MKTNQEMKKRESFT